LTGACNSNPSALNKSNAIAVANDFDSDAICTNVDDCIAVVVVVVVVVVRERERERERERDYVFHLDANHRPPAAKYRSKADVYLYRNYKKKSDFEK
jgi:nucleoside-diphosphate-sugar epimerase